MNCKHRTWAEISLDAIEHNLRAIKSRLKPGVKLLCSIKANAYGHGALPLAHFLHDKCDYFGLAALEEAIALRQAGIDKPMLLLGYTSPGLYHCVIEHNLIQTIFSLEQAQALSATAKKAGKTAHAHLAVDTGMGRIGFANTEQSLKDIKQIIALPNLAIEGIFTHFASADHSDKTLTQTQYQRFDQFLSGLRIANSELIKHACNSAALIDFDQHYDLVRIGIAMYGHYPSEQINKSALPLAPALEWKTRVSHLKAVPVGTGISYGHSFITTRETRVATLPVGYADGYPRALSNTGHVLIAGQRAPIIGKICMDQMMVDVTGIPSIALEDEVVLVGKSGKFTITLEDIAMRSGSLNYEVACRIGCRVSRLYTVKGEAYNI